MNFSSSGSSFHSFFFLATEPVSSVTVLTRATKRKKKLRQGHNELKTRFSNGPTKTEPYIGLYKGGLERKNIFFITGGRHRATLRNSAPLPPPYLNSCCRATRRLSKHNPAAMRKRRRSRCRGCCPRRVTARELHAGALFSARVPRALFLPVDKAAGAVGRHGWRTRGAREPPKYSRCVYGRRSLGRRCR